MAVPPPTGPFPPNDGSNIFRRGVPKAAKPVPPPEDVFTPPPEPAEPLDLDDEDALFGTAPAHPVHDLDAALSGVILSEPSEDDLLLEEVDVVDDAIADPRPPAPPSAADSSIFAGGLLPPTGVGSGWLDASAVRKAEPTSGDLWSDDGLPADLPPPNQPPSTTKYSDAADLFADLRADSPPSDSLWVEADGDGEDTGRVSESEVRRVFDTSRDDPAAASMADFHLPDPPSSELFGRTEDLEFADVDVTSDPDAAGSSIFDKHLPDTEIVTDADNVDFNIPVPEGSHQPLSAVSGAFLAADADPDEVDSDLFGVESPQDLTDDRAPAIAAAVAAGALGGVGGPAAPRDQGRPGTRPRVVAKLAGVDDDEPAEPAEKQKKRGGLGGVLAGLATGLAMGVGGFALVYVTGLIPNEKKTAAVANVTPAGDPQAAAKVQQLTADLERATDKADQAAIELKQVKDGLSRRQAALDEANAKAEKLETDLTAAQKEAADGKKAAADSKKDLTAALASVDPLKKDADAAKKLADDLMKEVDVAKKMAADAQKDVDAEKKLTLAAAKERDDAKTALADAKKDADEKAKLYADAGAKLTDAEKKLKASEDTLGGLVKDLKASKLLDDKDDATKLPDAVKKLAAVASSGDAKKAAEMLVAAQRERDDAKAALAKAEADAKTAQAAAVKAKTDADKLVADATKAGDEKAKVAADEATKDLKKQLADATAAAKKAQDDLTAAKATARADAEAAMKAKLDDAVAKLKGLETDFAAKLAEARAGVVKIMPAEMAASEKAGRSYADGVEAYRRRLYQDAEKLFAAAAAAQPADARYWYYLGLARSYTATTGAEDAFKKGAEMEDRNKPSRKVIDAALEHLSRNDKAQVNKYRP